MCLVGQTGSDGALRILYRWSFGFASVGDARWRTTSDRAIGADGIFLAGAQRVASSMRSKIGQSLSIVVETSPNSNRANFPLKSEAKKFDGSLFGFRASPEKNCAYKSARYDALRESSGRDGEYDGVDRDGLA